MSTLSQFFSNSGRFRNNRQLYLVDGSYTFTVPNGVPEVLGVVIGGGGGGARVATTNSYYAFGGAGGGYAKGVIAVTPGQTLAVTVGARGAGAATFNASGSAGATSSIGAFLSATGGAGGSATLGTSPTAGSGSTSGVSEAFTSSGGSSGLVYLSSNHASGGGASGTPFGNGQTSSNSNNTITYQASAGGSWCCLPTKTFPAIQNLFEAGHGTASYGNVTFAASNSMGANGGGGGIFPGGRGGVYLSTPGLIQLSENGSGSQWWFPWEISGSGGGAPPPVDMRPGSGNGGPGASGGSALTNGPGPRAGNGGFGAGGSAAVSAGIETFAGSGGNGGGGGGLFALNEIGNNVFSGFGGPGAVILYW